jgi:hypothetical protein
VTHQDGAGARRPLPPRPVMLGLIGVLAIGLIASVVVGVRLVQGGDPGVAASSSARPGDPGSRTPGPSASALGTEAYAAVFDGDATGATDVSAALSRFLSSHDGERVALAEDGLYTVSQVVFTAHDMTIDFRGARIESTKVGVYGIFLIRSSTNLVVNDASIVGTGYEWSGGDANPLQWEHGIEIDSGSDITINHPTTRDVRGDGIYVGFLEGKNLPATGVVINDPDIVRSSRNGIAPVAGEVAIHGGTIYDSGLHGVDFEPNTDAGARSIVGLVDGTDIRRFSDLDVAGLTGYAVATAGYSSVKRPSIVVQNVTGDELRMAIWDTAVVTIRDNVSDVEALADFPGSDDVTFVDNVRISKT